MLSRKLETGRMINIEGGGRELPPEEKAMVFALADQRRLNYRFRRELTDFSKAMETGSVDRERQQAELAEIKKEALGEAEWSRDLAENILRNKESIMVKADQMAKADPSFAKFSYANLAKAEQAVGENYQASFDLAKAGENGRSARASDFMTEAILLGILQKEMKDKKLPEDIVALAEVATGDEEFLRACALALPELKQDDFLTCLPAEIRVTARSIMDRELSAVLGHDQAVGTEVAEREGVKNRLGENLQSILEQEGDSGHGLLAEITDALGNLGGEDGKRLLLEVGLKSLKKEKNPIKSLTKNAQLARLVKELFEIDQKMGGNLAMKFLARQEVPDSFFVFMAEKSIKEKYLTKGATGYLKDRENIPWLRRLIAQYPNQFNTVIDTISQLPDYEPAKNQEEIFEAVEDLGSLTPIIFNRYHEAGSSGRQELAKKIKDLKPKFFRNEPIAKILPKPDRDILAEMIYLAYQPVGMDFKDVEKLIGKLEDQTDDLAEYKFPDDGYDFTLSGEKKYELKSGEKLDWQKFTVWRDMFDSGKLQAWQSAESARLEPDAETAKPESGHRQAETKVETKKDMAVLADAAKGKSEFSPLEIGQLLKPLAETGMAAEFLTRYPKVDENNCFSFLSELQEIVGVFFKDNFEPELAKTLAALENEPDWEKIAGILGNSKRQQSLERLMGGKLTVDWQKIGETEEAAKVLSQYIAEKVIKPWRSAIKKNLNKFQAAGGGSAVVSRGGLKAYASKNVGSFFAKASAGICTAQDIGLFNRDDHFHINIVENDESVRGNIQAYIIKDGSGRSLVLRGFNPNSEFLKRIDVEAFCEKVLDIGQQFVKDNNLNGLYIAEQDGGWHALSNRTEAFNYLKRYLKERMAKRHVLQVSSGHSINTIYKVG